VRETRAQRRQNARALAKQIVKQGRKSYGRELLIAIASIFIPIAWSETVRGSSVWRLAVGWLLWMPPLIFGIHVLWRWSDDVKKLLLFRYFLAIGAFVSLALLGSYSIWRASRPSFLLCWPGLVFADGKTRAYYFAAERKSVQNPTIIISDSDNALNSLTLRPGNIDPRPEGFADYFKLQPTNLGHEKLTVITQAKDNDTDEQLFVETRGFARFPSWKVIIRNSRTGKIIFQCESADFPHRSGFPVCPQNPLEVQ
jgi:hypothetical protein